MQRLTRADLLPLEHYAEQRPQLRRDILVHKRDRQVVLGDHLRLLFEDRRTIRYQVQEMLRAERIFEATAIQAELDAYNPLIPDGDNWKATLLIEYEDSAERRPALERLKGVEDRLYAAIGDIRVCAIADEDLERENEVKTASVHFLRFQLPVAAIAALRSGAGLAFGCDHPHYTTATPVNPAQRQALMADLA